MAYTPTLYSGYKKFEYDPYSSQYAENISNLTDTIGNMGEYQSEYSDTIKNYADRIANFNYDPDTDATYQAYKNQYTQLGKDAYKNTLAQVAARTGGNPSSYAQSNASQQYNYYMQELANKVPELRSLALGELQNNLSMYQNLDDTAYNRYNDATTNLYNQLSMYNGLDATDYSRYQDALNMAYNQWQYDAGIDYDNYQTAENARYQNYQNEWDAQQNALNRQAAASAANYEGQIADLYALIQQLMDKSGDTNADVTAKNSGNRSNAVVALNEAARSGDLSSSKVNQLLNEITRNKKSGNKIGSYSL